MLGFRILDAANPDSRPDSPSNKSYQSFVALFLIPQR
jgi:hypothetical protein